MTVVFSDPPPSNNSWQLKYQDVFDACKKRPLEWAEYPGMPSSARHRFGFRFTTRRHANGKRDVWVRYDPDLDQTLTRQRRIGKAS